MNEQDWLMHFLSEEEMPGEETSLGDFLWANGYFDFWDEYRSCLKPTALRLCDADGCRMYMQTLELGPLRALIAHVFRDLMRQYEQLPFPYRPFFAAAFYRLIELEAHRPTLEELWRTDCRDIPCAKGIYRVMVPAGKTVRFLPVSVLRSWSGSIRPCTRGTCCISGRQTVTTACGSISITISEAVLAPAVRGGACGLCGRWKTPESWWWKRSCARTARPVPAGFCGRICKKTARTRWPTAVSKTGCFSPRQRVS